MKAKTTEEITSSMKGFTPAQLAVVRFAKRLPSGEVVEVKHRRGAIIYGDEAATLVASGKAIEIVDQPPEVPQ
jgi:hypothetical protein